jgi:hypothetical protein
MPCPSWYQSIGGLGADVKQELSSGGFAIIKKPEAPARHDRTICLASASGFLMKFETHSEIRRGIKLLKEEPQRIGFPFVAFLVAVHFSRSA